MSAKLLQDDGTADTVSGTVSGSVAVRETRSNLTFRRASRLGVAAVLGLAACACAVGWGLAAGESQDAPAAPPNVGIDVPKDEPGPDAKRESSVNPARLIEQLGSSRYATRETATKELEELGPPVLPALEKAAKDAKDPEVRLRAEAIRDKIEKIRIVAPTMLTCRFQEKTLESIVDVWNIEASQGSSQLTALTKFNPAHPAWKKPISLDGNAKEPFWKALTQLSVAANLRLQFSNTGMGARSNTIQLMPADAARPPADPDSRLQSQDGPFYAVVSQLQYNRSINLFNGLEPAPNATPRSAFSLQIQAFAEPRLMLGQSQNARIIEAVDENGLSLLPKGNNVSGFGSHSVMQGQVVIPVTLDRPENSGKRIRKLKGVLPMNIAARRGSPITLTLDKAPQPAVVQGDTTLVLDSIERDPNQGIVVELTVRSTNMDFSNGNAYGNAHAMIQNQMEILDEAGAPTRWFLRRFQPNPNGELKIDIQVMSNNPGLPAVMRNNLNLDVMKKAIAKKADDKKDVAKKDVAKKDVAKKEDVKKEEVKKIEPPKADNPPAPAPAPPAPGVEQPKAPGVMKLRFYELKQASMDFKFEFQNIPMP